MGKSRTCRGCSKSWPSPKALEGGLCPDCCREVQFCSPEQIREHNPQLADELDRHSMAVRLPTSRWRDLPSETLARILMSVVPWHKLDVRTLREVRRHLPEEWFK